MIYYQFAIVHPASLNPQIGNLDVSAFNLGRGMNLSRDVKPPAYIFVIFLGVHSIISVRFVALILSGLQSNIFTSSL